jgi:hypothetical protein
MTLDDIELLYKSEPVNKTKGKIIQIASSEHGVSALRDDGTVWVFCNGSWYELPCIP